MTASDEFLPEVANSRVQASHAAAASTVGAGLNGFSLLLNVIDVSVDLPREIVPGLQLAKAEQGQAVRLRELMREFRSGPLHSPSIHDTEWTPVEGGAFETTELPEEKWRYIGVRFDASRMRLDDLERASLLVADAELWLGLSIWKMNKNSRGYATFFRTENVLHVRGNATPFGTIERVTLTEEKVRRLGEVLTAVASHDDDLIDVSGRLSDLLQLRGLEHRSRLAFLGYFGLIESFLASSPQPGDPYNTITRQVRTKIALLENRFESPLPYELFDQAKHETIWTKLYSYRSRLAHGSSVDFRGELSVLRGEQNAMRFVRTVGRRLVQHCLREPVLMKDLLSC